MSGTASEWLTFAREDVRVAELVLNEGIYNQVCFHSQQCVEKSLKAVLAHLGHAPPRTHFIADLLKILPQAWVASLPVKLIQLDVLYTPTRYPDTLPGMLPDGLPDKEKAEEMLSWARDVLAKAEHYTNQ